MAEGPNATATETYILPVVSKASVEDLAEMIQQGITQRPADFTFQDFFGYDDYILGQRDEINGFVRMSVNDTEDIVPRWLHYQGLAEALMEMGSPFVWQTISNELPTYQPRRANHPPIEKNTVENISVFNSLFFNLAVVSIGLAAVLGKRFEELVDSEERLSQPSGKVVRRSETPIMRAALQIAALYDTPAESFEDAMIRLQRIFSNAAHPALVATNAFQKEKTCPFHQQPGVNILQAVGYIFTLPAYTQYLRSKVTR